MVRYEYVTPVSRSGLLSLRDVAAVVDGLRAGGLAVLPTETGYMLAAVATATGAVRKAFAAKQRNPANPMHIACSSLAMAGRYGILDGAAAELLGRFTPGPLTVVVAKTPRLPEELVTLRGTVGIRVPDCAATLQVIAALDAPLTATSLNRSGAEHLPVSRGDLDSLVWPDDEVVWIVRADEVLAYDRPSTLLRLTGPRPEVLRPGPITLADLAVLGGA